MPVVVTVPEVIPTARNVEQVKSLRQGLRRIRWATENLDGVASTLDRLLSPMPNAETVAALEVVKRSEFVAELKTEGEPGPLKV